MASDAGFRSDEGMIAPESQLDNGHVIDWSTRQSDVNSDHAIVTAIDGNLRARRLSKAGTDERRHGQCHVV